MSIRSHFDKNLAQLKQMLVDMASQSENAIKEAMFSFFNQDMKKAKQVIARDYEIDEMEQEIHNKALQLITRESPVAKDLRKINVAIKVSSEIERIGDMAVNIAKSVIQIGKEKPVKEFGDILKMMELSLDMVRDALTAYYTEDISIAYQCAEKDDEVDQTFGKLVQKFLSYTPQDPNGMNQIIQLAFVCRFIERIADHSTNIAENVIFLETGERKNLNA
ncbi:MULTISPECIES: phosphate signaling complex protein PhoU [Neobacillus]|jgi:phosphate transport system protein|uniref:Phosphate-specific transport system accessory protein PhoU n=2 Tax=Neobacillus TaxID=2675232 RepID=A0A6B3TT69_9BACI|nr:MULTISPECIES: phosphate signaling complex protein PhoU [Neobacillus]AIM15611.1 PhoU family transcriptional regulator [Bacillus sp. X1(2014)]MCD4838116.1 phosphate signaling complex protein PhoU [Neobacillus sedimentimangrovi]MED3625601.1 phosphate signaling complex protein PhoU [Neobacillus thermocopriae]MED3715560.1 phosphate signaling complex protein PhoU [Neobacillus thermocopriae]NEX79678.1 phosphate signaling complex protein PhoU [Neobacillus thermocopriae]